MTDLVFDRVSTSSTDLVFGEEFVPATALITITGTLPAMTVLVKMIPPAKVTIACVLPAMALAVQARYLTNTQRPAINQVVAVAQIATSVESGITNSAQQGVTTNNWFSIDSQEATSQSSILGASAKVAMPSSIDTEVSFTEADLSRTTSDGAFQNGDRHWFNFFSKFQEADRLAATRLRGKFEEGLRDRRPSILSIFQEAIHLPGHSYRGGAGPGVHINRYWDVIFQNARVPPPGQYVPPVVPIDPPNYWGTDLVFMCPPLEFPDLVFGIFPCDVINAVVVVPVRRVYIVINSATLTRVEGNISLPVLSMSLSLNMESWTWTFSARLPSSTLANLEPSSAGAPVEVSAVINGVDYRMLIESINRDRTFGKSVLSVSGRGINAVLDSPYAPQRSYTNPMLTANQIMLDILTLSGIPLGWDVNWGLTDWNVPAGVLSNYGPYLPTLQMVAASVGGYIQPTPSDMAINVLPKYPSLPRDWGSVTADYALPSSVVSKEGISWVEKPRYNRVYVSGVSQGVRGQVTVTGTAGDLVAPMVNDALITEAVAARQRGIAILGDCGRIANVTLALPVLPATGIILPGKFIQYIDGGVTRMGLTRSVSVSVELPSIVQTLGVETHVS